MQKSITLHTNPMTNKRPFIKKSLNPSVSLISKPNLSITKASHRFSLDNTFTYSDRRHESYIKTVRNHQRELASPEMFEQDEQSFTERSSLRPVKNQQLSKSLRRSSLRIDKRRSHKQKLQSILQSIDLNNSIIEEMFEQDDEICLYQEQINKSLDFMDRLSTSLQHDQNKYKRENVSRPEPQLLDEKIKVKAKRELCKKIEELRKKRLSFAVEGKSRLGTFSDLPEEANGTFT